ncbi:NlpC/P60 family protein [Nocardioides sp.]|uniref:C40 family peptidase n=1 Tax=Nocardioides sp. TaxID=35761 RepID=UPI003561CCB1
MRLVAALSGMALVASSFLTASGPAQAEPDIESVQARVDRLYHEAEEATERQHDARLELTELRADLASLKADQERQRRSLEAVRAELQDSIVTQYQGLSMVGVGQVVVSEDPAAFLSGLSTMSALRGVQAQQFDSFATQAKALNIRTQATAGRLAQISRVEKQMTREKATVSEKLAEAKTLLERLKDQEREELLSRSSVRLPSGVPTSGRAAAAVAYAMAQVGKRYSYGAAGPSSFDCSGLTMRAWGQAGVGLPHSSRAQFGSGPRVAAADLRPGDLVFYYSPISHVGIYIGNGLIVDAANPRAGVRVTSLHSMPYVGAVRPG